MYCFKLRAQDSSFSFSGQNIYLKFGEMQGKSYFYIFIPIIHHSHGVKHRQGKFQKRLRLFDATAIVTGSMIGSGIFIVSADIARNVGAPGWLLLVWLITGVLTIIAALTYGELASLMPHAGGQYVFLKEAYNPLVGFLYGWSAFLVIQGGTIAAVAMGFAKFTGVVFPWVSENNIWFEWHFLKFSTVHLVAIGSILLLTFFNTQGNSVRERSSRISLLPPRSGSAGVYHHRTFYCPESGCP